MLEKLALLKIAFCSAPAFSSASSACLRAVLSVALAETLRVFLASLALALVPGLDTCHVDTSLRWTLK
jgi:hypothetical protein